jgi:hypothetical protein
MVVTITENQDKEQQTIKFLVETISILVLFSFHLVHSFNSTVCAEVTASSELKKVSIFKKRDLQYQKK